MKISLSPTDFQELEHLFSALDTNIENSKSVLDFVQYYSRSIKPISLKKINLSPERAYEIMMRRALGVNDKSNPICRVYTVDSAIYQKNPYYQTIKLNQIKDTNWHLENTTYEPYEAFILDDVSVNERGYFEETYFVGFFKERFSFINLAQDDITWMSITPNEIETMKKPISNVKGKVITFGLGLGYFAFMAAIKPDVASVTIIEKDPKVINLFKTEILPQFPNKDKINIIEQDAFDYLDESMAAENYDFAFVDIWRSVDDGFPLYLKFKALEQRIRGCTFLYWLDDAMIVMLRRYVISLMRETLEGWQAKDYANPENDIDLIFKNLYQLLKETTLRSFDDVLALLKTSYLKTLAYKIL